MSIGASSSPNLEVGVATSSGKAYYKIASFLKRLRVPYCDILLSERPLDLEMRSRASTLLDESSLPRIILTTRRERLQIPRDNVLCIEDLGDDFGVAKEKLISTLYPPKETDVFLVGIDPGERTGVAAFLNHREVESVVLSSFDEIITLVSKLLENAPRIRKIVKIGYGNPKMAQEIASGIEAACPLQVKIQFVDERGTSTLVSRARAGKKRAMIQSGTRDQVAAKLIAFREGRDYQSHKIRAG